MDFTSGIFNFRNEALPNTHPQTTLAKQLALSVVLFSPLQMASDMIENYEHQSAFSFITSCPTTWAKTVVPASQIGEYVIVPVKTVIAKIGLLVVLQTKRHVIIHYRLISWIKIRIIKQQSMLMVLELTMKRIHILLQLQK